MQLVDVSSLISDAIVDLRYTTNRNVLNRPIDGAATSAQLDTTAAQALRRAAELFRQQHLRLVIWDAYRSNQVQEQLRAVEPDDQYVLKESNHCLGLAVDVTLATDTDERLDMGTDHDDFSPMAHTDAQGLTAEQAHNRQLLIDIMQQAGFRVWPYEWWHFDYIGDDI